MTPTAPRIDELAQRRAAHWAVVFGAIGVGSAMTWTALTDAASLLWAASPLIAAGTFGCLASAWLAGLRLGRTLSGRSARHAYCAGVLTAWSALLGGTAAGALLYFCLAAPETIERGFWLRMREHALWVAVVPLYGGLPALVLGLAYTYVVRTRRAPRASPTTP